MSIGIGVDLVAIERIERAWKKSGDRFLDRILSATERIDFASASNPVNFLAKRFAAKEAVAKALGTGISQGISWVDIAVSHSSLGQPIVKVSGLAAERMEALGGRSVLLSLADEHDRVIAFAQLV